MEGDRREGQGVRPSPGQQPAHIARIARNAQLFLLLLLLLLLLVLLAAAADCLLLLLLLGPSSSSSCCRRALPAAPGLPTCPCCPAAAVPPLRRQGQPEAIETGAAARVAVQVAIGLPAHLHGVGPVVAGSAGQHARCPARTCPRLPRSSRSRVWSPWSRAWRQMLRRSSRGRSRSCAGGKEVSPRADEGSPVARGSREQCTERVCRQS